MGDAEHISIVVWADSAALRIEHQRVKSRIKAKPGTVGGNSPFFHKNDFVS